VKFAYFFCLITKLTGTRLTVRTQVHWGAQGSQRNTRFPGAQGLKKKIISLICEEAQGFYVNTLKQTWI
jgi:hypothetical protein